MCSASSFCRWASTPSFTSPGSRPSSCAESCSTPSIVMISCSPALLVTVHCRSDSTRLHGGLIQFSGLYEPPSECTRTEPSAFTSSNRVASGRGGGNRPPQSTPPRGKTGPRSPRCSGQSRDAQPATLPGRPPRVGRRLGQSRRNQRMTVPNISLNTGAAMPQLGFGVFQVPPKDVEQVVRTALDAGYRSIDTAAMYRNEEGVGRAVTDSGLPRSEVFVTTKLDNPTHKSGDGERAAEGSLGRLGFDYVDLYLIHWPLPSADRYVEVWRV